MKFSAMICRLVDVEFDPDETVITEAGAINYMEKGITFEAKTGDESTPDSEAFEKLLDAGKQVLRCLQVCYHKPVTYFGQSSFD